MEEWTGEALGKRLGGEPSFPYEMVKEILVKVGPMYPRPRIGGNSWVVGVLAGRGRMTVLKG